MAVTRRTDGLGPRVLVGFAESLAAIESVWILLDQGYEVLAFTRLHARSGLRRDPRVRLLPVPAPESDTEGCLAAIVRILDETATKVLMPLDDAALLLADALSARHPDVVVAGPVGRQARIALDKALQSELALEAGLSLPPTVTVRAGDSVSEAVVAAGSPPWIVKPADAVTRVGTGLGKGPSSSVSTHEQLMEALTARTDTVLVQRHVSGVGRGVFGLAEHGAVSWVSGHERVRMMNPSGSGSSACRAHEPSPGLVAGVERFMARSEWHGLFMLEFLHDDDGTSWFMELNGRTWGSMALARARGLHYPAWAVDLALGHRPPDPPTAPVPRPDVVARHVGRELLHLAFVARGRRQLRRRQRTGGAVDPSLLGYPSLPEAIGDVARWHPGDVYYNARRGHLRVLADDTVDTLLSVVRRR